MALSATSDRGHNAAADAVAAAALALHAGTDLSCGSEYRNLPAAVQRGLLSEAAVDSALTRLLRTRFRLGLFDPPDRVPFNRIAPDVNDSDANRALALETARASLVLLKNDGALPLRSGIRRIAVIGPDANDVDVLLGNYNGYPSSAVTPLEGMRRAAAARGIEVTWTRGADVAEGIASLEPVPASVLADLSADYFANHAFEGTPFATRTEPAIDHQWWRRAPLAGMPADSFSVRWTGTFVPPVSGRYALGARAMGSARLFLDDSLIVQLNDRHVVLARSASVELEAGTRHQLRLEFFDRRADASVQLVWAPPAPSLQEEAVTAARDADVAVMFLGLSPRLEGEEMRVEVPGFSGGDRVAIDLPATQQELLRAVVATGTPVVLVLVNGSALAVPWAAQHVPAILEAWYPGQAAGDAIADVLFGAVSPAGRLPVTVYGSVGDLPPFDDYDMAGRTYRYFMGQALFPFGHGLSYSTFRYHDLRVPARAQAGDSVEVSVEVENAGSMRADEVVQLYVSDVEGSVPVPIRALAGFRRIRLESGARMRVSFTLAPDAFSLIDDGGRRVVEPGTFEISVGGTQPGQSGLADAPTTQVLTARLEVAR